MKSAAKKPAKRVQNARANEIDVDDDATGLADKMLTVGSRKSSEYREGMIAALRRYLDGVPIRRCYYIGSAGADAFDAGIARVAEELAFRERHTTDIDLDAPIRAVPSAHPLMPER